MLRSSGKTRPSVLWVRSLGEEAPTDAKDGNLGSLELVRAIPATFTLEVGGRRDDRSGAGLTCYFFGLLGLLMTSRSLSFLHLVRLLSADLVTV